MRFRVVFEDNDCGRVETNPGRRRKGDIRFYRDDDRDAPCHSCDSSIAHNVRTAIKQSRETLTCTFNGHSKYIATDAIFLHQISATLP
jgi:hypothetical protein